MGDSTVVPISKNVELPAKREANEHVVKRLADLLEKAKAGEIVGIAYAIHSPGDYTGYNYAGRVGRSTIGTLFVLQQQLAADDFKQTEDE